MHLVVKEQWETRVAQVWGVLVGWSQEHTQLRGGAAATEEQGVQDRKVLMSVAPVGLKMVLVRGRGMHKLVMWGARRLRRKVVMTVALGVCSRLQLMPTLAMTVVIRAGATLRTRTMMTL